MTLTAANAAYRQALANLRSIAVDEADHLDLFSGNAV